MDRTAKSIVGFFNGKLAPVLTALSENTYMSAIRAGMVSIVPLTIIGGFFIIVTEFPVSGWSKLIEPWAHFLRVPVKATFGLLAVFACFSIAYDLGKRLGQEAIVSASMATLVFLMIQLRLDNLAFDMDGLESKGLFTAILVALISVRIQKWFTDKNLVIKLPRNVPEIVYESFVSLVPMFVLVVLFWLLRFVLGVDIPFLDRLEIFEVTDKH
ncbi:MAG TPA: PTS transporter subunit EIIC, partial [Verrucomicrobiota bacterium]|nr:PTS transporter subunit EIIC [Verrucomicrobiota bacterium]